MYILRLNKHFPSYENFAVNIIMELTFNIKLSTLQPLLDVPIINGTSGICIYTISRVFFMDIYIFYINGNLYN